MIKAYKICGIVIVSSRMVSIMKPQKNILNGIGMQAMNVSFYGKMKSMITYRNILGNS